MKDIQIFLIFYLREGTEGNHPLKDFVHDMLHIWLELGPNKSLLHWKGFVCPEPFHKNHPKERCVQLCRAVGFEQSNFLWVSSLPMQAKSAPQWRDLLVLFAL